jgi:hypothetical protein
MDVTLLYFDDCPNWQTTDRLLTELSSELDFSVTRRLVATTKEAGTLGFWGSPTVLIDGIDPFAQPDGPTGLSCRIYTTPDGLRGSPTIGMLRAALSR